MATLPDGTTVTLQHTEGWNISPPSMNLQHTEGWNIAPPTMNLQHTEGWNFSPPSGFSLVHTERWNFNPPPFAFEINMAADKRAISPGDTVTLTGSIRDNRDGSAVEEEPVALVVDGAVTATTTTDASGGYSFEWTPEKGGDRVLETTNDTLGSLQHTETWNE